MDPLEDSLDLGKWEHREVSQKEGYKEYQVLRQHKKLSPTSWRYVIQQEGDEDPMGVIVECCSKDKDPLKDIGTAELKLKEDKVIGIDLDGDRLELK